MNSGALAPATLPPPGLAELDPGWSRLVTVLGLDGVERSFHVLDNRVADPVITLLCIHGNPSWAYLWRQLLAEAPPGVRVIAPDQLDMGFSERTGTTRRLRQRIQDLDALTDCLDLTGQVVTVGHDWGGPISLGWAHRHLDRLAGVVLSNTAVHQPAAAPVPRLIRLARNRRLLDWATVKTPAFVRGAIGLSRTRPTAAVRDAYLAPYRTRNRRTAIRDFVADIPLEPDHPSASTLDQVAADLDDFGSIPKLLVWGASDPVFSDRYLHDLEARLPHADVHRYVTGGHYVPEEANFGEVVHAWVAALHTLAQPTVPREQRAPLWAGLERRAGDRQTAVIEMAAAGPGRSVTFADLNADVARVSAGMYASGVRKGDRVALLVPPGVDLTVCLYACWRMGAVTVVADAGLGLRGIGRALESSAPRYVIGVPRALAAAKAMRWPGRRISVSSMSEPATRVLGVWATLDAVRRQGEGRDVPPEPSPDDLAAVVFTSGATGPAKGVSYRHHQAQAQRDALMQLYSIGPTDRLVAAFPPFALYGPAMGISSVVPEMRVTSPGSLSAVALADAVAAIGASIVFASPAALRNVVATAKELTPVHREAFSRVRLLISAGAPVSPEVLRLAGELMSGAEAHTPYGMTEVLPVTDISLTDIEGAGGGHGVCVGQTLKDVEVAIDPLDELGRPGGELVTQAGVVGEICIRAAHVKDGYDRLWVTQQASAQPPGWHRSGDVGQLDDKGRLWIEGRLVHIIETASGPLTPVGIELAAQSVPAVELAAAIGVGPVGTKQVVVVVVPRPRARRAGLATESLADQIRAAVGVEVAAVLVVPELPVDKRHNSKIDRTRVARWASAVLAGGRIGRL